MANHRAIAATSAALAGLIRDHYPRDEFGAGLEVKLYQMRDFESPMQDGFSVCLYRVSVNGSAVPSLAACECSNLRAHPWSTR